MAKGPEVCEVEHLRDPPGRNGENASADVRSTNLTRRATQPNFLVQYGPEVPYQSLCIAQLLVPVEGGLCLRSKAICPTGCEKSKL